MQAFQLQMTLEMVTHACVVVSYGSLIISLA